MYGTFLVYSGWRRQAYEALKTMEILGVDKKSDLKLSYLVQLQQSGKQAPLAPSEIDQSLLQDKIASRSEVVLGEVRPGFHNGALIAHQDEALNANKLWFPEKTDAESHNSDAEHDEAVTRKQSYFIGMRGLLSCGEKVVSRITTAIVAYGLFNIQDTVAESSSSFENCTCFDRLLHQLLEGLTSFAASESRGLSLAGDNIVGLAKFYLGVGTSGDAEDFFNQIDALALFSVSLILCHFIDKERASEVSLSANHLQKLWLSHELTSPLGHVFKPHQVGISSCPNPHSPPLFLKQLLQYHTLPLRLPMKELSS
ncbi:hypothetical protein YC2023_026522 [Brassica napus]